jgi:SOS-response transcriptional repressor LexA
VKEDDRNFMRPNKDHVYLGKLRDYFSQQHILPNYETIADLVGMRSTAAAFTMVERLKKEGFIEISPDRRLQPGRRFFESVLFDSAQVGSQQVATNHRPVGYDIVRHLLQNPSKTVLLKVRGESMLDAGLLPDDHVVVIRNATAAVGDIVVALIDCEYTIKYLAEDDTGLYLKPGNKEYKEIRPTNSLEIFGVVTGSFRSYTPSRAA